MLNLKKYTVYRLSSENQKLIMKNSKTEDKWKKNYISVPPC